MHRGSSLRAIRMIRPDPTTMSISLLAFFFFLGGLLGHVYAGRCDFSAQTAFRDYLSDYCLWFGQTGTSVSFTRCLLLYFSGVCAAFLFGFSSLGVVFIPLFSSGLGFFAFYTVSCFAQAFGKNGVLLAAALIAIRLVFTLPCFFAVAGESLLMSLRLAALTIGREKRLPPTGGRYFVIFILCLFCLCVGVFFERFLTPILFRAAVNAVEFGS